MTDHEHNTQAHEWWRFFGNLRFTQLAFYGVVAGLLLNAQHEGTRTSLQEIKLAGVLITGVVWLMEVSSTLHGIAWKKNAKPDPPTWLLFPFNASNAALVFYALAYRYWWSDLTEHLFIVKISFYILVIWSVFAYLPVWFYSARSFGQTFDTYYRSFLDKAPEPTQEAPNHAHSSSPRDDDSSPDKPRWGFTPLTIAQAGLVLTAIIAFIYYFQLRSMQDSVKLTGLALEADQRPWVKLDYGKAQLTTTLPVIQEITITDIGKTPLLKLRAHLAMELVRNGDDPQFDWNKAHRESKVPILLPNSPSITPAELRDSNDAPHAITQAEIDSLKSGQVVLITYAKVAYDDTLGVGHWQQFCNWMAFPGVDQLNQTTTQTKCAEFNDTERKKAKTD